MAARKRATKKKSAPRRRAPATRPRRSKAKASGADLFVCASCGEEHDLEQLSFGADAPAQWALLSEEERADSTLGSDQCVIEAGGQTHRFVRGVLQLPVRGGRRGTTYDWGVWVSLSEKSFDEMAERWEDPRRARLGPYFGWLCTAIPGYPDTMFLKTNVVQRAVGLRPLVELEPTEHPLAVQQREGIARDELLARMSALLHEGG